MDGQEKLEATQDAGPEALEASEQDNPPPKGQPQLAHGSNPTPVEGWQKEASDSASELPFRLEDDEEPIEILTREVVQEDDLPDEELELTDPMFRPHSEARGPRDPESPSASQTNERSADGNAPPIAPELPEQEVPRQKTRSLDTGGEYEHECTDPMGIGDVSAVLVDEEELPPPPDGVTRVKVVAPSVPRAPQTADILYAEDSSFWADEGLRNRVLILAAAAGLVIVVLIPLLLNYLNSEVEVKEATVEKDAAALAVDSSNPWTDSQPAHAEFTQISSEQSAGGVPSPLSDPQGMTRSEAEKAGADNDRDGEPPSSAAFPSSDSSAPSDGTTKQERSAPGIKLASLPSTGDGVQESIPAPLPNLASTDAASEQGKKESRPPPQAVKGLRNKAATQSEARLRQTTTRTERSTSEEGNRHTQAREPAAPVQAVNPQMARTHEANPHATAANETTQHVAAASKENPSPAAASDVSPHAAASLQAKNSAVEKLEPGSLRLNSRPPATISIDGVARGDTSKGLLQLELLAGVHQMVFVEVGGERSLEEQVIVVAGQRLTCVAYFQKKEVECR